MEKSFNVNLIACGRQDCSDMHSFGPAIRDRYIIHYVIKGKGYFRNEKGVFAVNAGDTFLIEPYRLIEYYPDEADPWEYEWVDFYGEDGRKWFRMCGFDKMNPVIASPNRERMEVLFDMLVNDGMAAYEKMESQAYLQAILGMYADIYYSGRNAEGYGADELRAEKAKRIIMSEFYKQEFNINVLTEQMNVSQSTLYRAIFASDGVSPQEYLLSTRLAAADILLQKGAKVKEVALSAGFSDPLYFSKAYKKRYGVTPKERMRGIYPA